MAEKLKQFEAVFIEWEGLECRLGTIAFEVEDESDALLIAEDISTAGREGSELIYLGKLYLTRGSVNQERHESDRTRREALSVRM